MFELKDIIFNNQSDLTVLMRFLLRLLLPVQPIWLADCLTQCKETHKKLM